MNEPKHASPWFESVPDQRRYPVLSGDVAADVAVVGGGMVGIVAAWHLAKAGRRVVLLEKNHIAANDSGYTTAFLTRVPDVNIADLERRYGAEAVRRIFAATTQAQTDIFTLIKDKGIACDFRTCGSYHVSFTPDSGVLHKEWKVLRRVDERASWVVGREIDRLSPSAREAVRCAGEGRFDARRFLFGLLDRAGAPSIKIFEESPVTNIQFGPSITVTTPNGAVHAKNIVLATGKPLPQIAGIPALEERTTYAIAARYGADAPISDDIFWDTDLPYQYYRRLDNCTIILGGADHPVHRKPEHNPFGVLENFLEIRFAAAFTVTHRWSGSLLATDDGLPIIDTIPDHPNAAIATGLLGNGMVMGAMAGSMLANLTLGRNTDAAKPFSVQRLPPKTAAAVTTTHSSILTHHTNWPVWLFPLLYAAFFVLPAAAFFSARGGLGFLDGASFTMGSRLLFPLFGLYAFFFVWVQFLLGSNMALLRQKIPWIERFHRTEGVFALLFALTHPSLILFAYGLDRYLAFRFVAPGLKAFVWIGELQLLLIILTATTALLRKKAWLQRRWHYIHYCNYLIFALVWVHSWFLGSDVQTTSLKYLWYFFALTAVLSLVGRIMRARRQQKKQSTASIKEKTFVRVASVGDIREGTPFCAEVRGKQIAVFKIDGAYYAIDNLCSHAGGPLCAGALEGNVIECPLHGSKFDVRTGAVLAPPARIAQQTYPVRIKGEDVLVAGV